MLENSVSPPFAPSGSTRMAYMSDANEGMNRYELSVCQRAFTFW